MAEEAAGTIKNLCAGGAVHAEVHALVTRLVPLRTSARPLSDRAYLERSSHSHTHGWCAQLGGDVMCFSGGFTKFQIQCFDLKEAGPYTRFLTVVYWCAHMH